MQSLGTFVKDALKHSAMKKFGKKDFSSQFGELKGLTAGDKLICPLCKYEKKGRGSAKIFKNEDGTSFKCFACGAWRLLK